MATNLVNELETLRPSANDLKNSTDWPDWLIDDYLTLLNNLIAISTAVDAETIIIDNSQQDLSGVSLDISLVRAISSSLKKEQAKLKEEQTNLKEEQAKLDQATNEITTQKLLALIASQDKRIKKLEQQVV